MSSTVLKHKRATLERLEKYISEIYFTNVNLFDFTSFEIEVKKFNKSTHRIQQIKRTNPLNFEIFVWIQI